MEGVWSGGLVGGGAGEGRGAEGKGVRARQGDEGKGEGARGKERRRVEKLLGEARAELSVQELFGERFWDGDGVWRFEVVGGAVEGGEGDVTFREVAEQHPLIRKWMGVVRGEAERWGVDLRGFEGEEWERGRVGDEVAMGA